MMSSFLQRSVATVALMFTLTASAFVALSASGAATDQRSVAPPFSLRDANNKSIRLADYKGRVVLLDFWATWCTGCKEEMPWFMEFDTKYRRAGLISIGVSLDEDGWTSVRPYLAQHLVTYPIVVGNLEFAASYGVTTAMPVTVLIDRNGRIADTHVGKVDKDMWEAEIQTLLQERRR